MLRAFNQKGFSLIEVMVAGVIMGIISLALMSMISNQRQELKSIGEKMLAFDVQSLVQRTMINSEYCGCAFNGKTFDSTKKNWNSFPTDFPLGYGAGCAATATSNIKVGSPVLSSTVKVKSLTMENINEIIAGSGNYVGQLTIELDPDTLVRAIRKIEVSVGFSVDTSDPVAAQNFISCSADNTGGAVGWIPEATTSALVHKALSDGFIVATSASNRGIRISTGPNAGSMTVKAFISARDKYGQGFVHVTVPVSKNEFWKAESTDVSQSAVGDNLTSIFFKRK